MRLLPTPLLLAALLGLSQCKHADPTPPDPASQLPPATQNGTSAFGCLLNGQPWIPSGFNGTDNYRLVYDPGYAGGDLEIRAYRYLPTQTENQYFYLSSSHMDKVGTYTLDGMTGGVSYNTGIQ